MSKQKTSEQTPVGTVSINLATGRAGPAYLPPAFQANHSDLFIFTVLLLIPTLDDIARDGKPPRMNTLIVVRCDHLEGQLQPSFLEANSTSCMSVDLSASGLLRQG